MARKTTGRGSKAGSGPETDETATETKAGGEQTPAPEVTQDKTLGTPPPAASVTPDPIRPTAPDDAVVPAAAPDAETQSLEAPVTTPEGVSDTTGPDAPPTGPDAPPGPGADSDNADRQTDGALPVDEKSGPSDAIDTPVVAAPPPPSGPNNGGFLPLILGGIVAGAIGYGAHYLVSQDAGEQTAQIAAMQDEIAQLRTDLAGVPDLSAVEAELAEMRAALGDPPDLSGQIAAEIDALRAEFDQADAGAADPELLARLDQMTADLSDTAARLDGIEDELTARDDQIAALETDLSEIRDLAENRVAEAEAALDTALARAGLDMLRTGLNTGTPYSDALVLLRDAGATVPETLAANAPAGVQTLEMLQESFPAAARAGLRASLQDAPADSTGERIANFLRAQTGARSTTPREGDDPDAVLSRAAAALEEGALDTTLAELDALPEPGRAAMQDWRRAAQARHDAEAEIETFATTLSIQ